MCQKWFVKFRAGGFSLDDDASWLGRPVEVDSEQIKTLIENNQRYTMWEIADILKIPKSIKLLVKMKNMSFILQKKIIQTFWSTQNNVLYIYDLLKWNEHFNFLFRFYFYQKYIHIISNKCYH